MINNNSNKSLKANKQIIKTTINIKKTKKNKQKHKHIIITIRNTIKTTKHNNQTNNNKQKQIKTINTY